MIDFRALLVESERSIHDAALIARIDDDELPAELREVLSGSHRHRQFVQIKAGRFGCSVQASHSHYCEPRVTTNDLTVYATWEVYCSPMGRELIDLIGGPDKLVDADLVEHFGHDSDDPASYVPTAIVQKYLDALEALGGEGPVLDAKAVTP